MSMTSYAKSEISTSTKLENVKLTDNTILTSKKQDSQSLRDSYPTVFTLKVVYSFLENSLSSYFIDLKVFFIKLD